MPGKYSKYSKYSILLEVFVQGVPLNVYSQRVKLI